MWRGALLHALEAAGVDGVGPGVGLDVVFADGALERGGGGLVVEAAVRSSAQDPELVEEALVLAVVGDLLAEAVRRRRRSPAPRPHRAVRGCRRGRRPGPGWCRRCGSRPPAAPAPAAAARRPRRGCCCSACPRSHAGHGLPPGAPGPPGRVLVVPWSVRSPWAALGPAVSGVGIGRRRSGSCRPRPRSRRSGRSGRRRSATRCARWAGLAGRR